MFQLQTQNTHRYLFYCIRSAVWSNEWKDEVANVCVRVTDVCSAWTLVLNINVNVGVNIQSLNATTEIQTHTCKNNILS